MPESPIAADSEYERTNKPGLAHHAHIDDVLCKGEITSQQSFTAGTSWGAEQGRIQGLSVLPVHALQRTARPACSHLWDQLPHRWRCAYPLLCILPPTRSFEPHGRTQRKGHPITYNHHFIDCVQKVRETHLRRSVKKKLREILPSPTFKQARQETHTFHMEELVAALAVQTETDMEKFACSEATDCTMAYYKVCNPTHSQ